MWPQVQGQYHLAAGSDVLIQRTLPGSRKLVNGKALFISVCIQGIVHFCLYYSAQFTINYINLLKTKVLDYCVYYHWRVFK